MMKNIEHNRRVAGESTEFAYESARLGALTGGNIDEIIWI